jgi:Flp pilus assembly protein TadG
MAETMRATVQARQPRRARGDDGTLLVELAIVGIFLFFVVFGVIDLGRAYSLQNRLNNAAREGAAVAQFKPGNVDTGCANGANVVDRATNEDSGLSSTPGFSVTVAKKVGSTLTNFTGCGTPSGATVSPGDTVVVTTHATFKVITPLIGALVGNNINVSRSTSVVVQG